MRTLSKAPSPLIKDSIDPMLIGAFGLIALVGFACVTALSYAGGWFDSFTHLFLLPWVLLLGAVLSIPIIFCVSRKGKGLESPLMIATVSYFFPAFVLGGFSLAIGWSQPYYVDFIQDIRTTLPFTIVLIMLGFAGLSLGYILPAGRRLGVLVGNRLPERNHEPQAYYIGGILILLIGLAASYYALLIGILGFQRGEESRIYDGIVYLMTLFPAQGMIILWWALFRQGRIQGKSWIIVGILFSTSILMTFLAGNRGMLVTTGLLMVLAYLLAGRKFTLRSAVATGMILVFLLLAGMIYGTTFRNIKGSMGRTGVAEYVENVGQSLSTLASGGTDAASLELGLTSLAQRLDIVSSVAVVVSNYEHLAPYEESYGLDHNIYKDLVSFFIPRLLWSDKPSASDPRAYSALYFEYDENSFAITPIGDLWRNFGAPGVFIGMFVLGFILRFIYSALVENRPPNLLRSTLYLMLVFTVSYEGFYGTIIPMFFKIAVVAIAGLVLVEVVTAQVSKRRYLKPLIPRRNGATA